LLGEAPSAGAQNGALPPPAALECSLWACAHPPRAPWSASNVMWPFRRDETRQPWIEEALQRIHVTVLEVQRRQEALEIHVGSMTEGAYVAKQMSSRTQALETRARQLETAMADELAALRSALEVVRGLATGARGGRPRNEEREADRQALELGRRVIQATATPEGRAQLALELQGAGVDPVGAAKWNPRGETNGSPV